MKTKLFLLTLLLICLFGCEQSETSTLNVELSETNQVSMYEKSTEDMFDFMKQVYPEKYAKYYSIKNQFKPEILTKVSNNNFAKYAKSTTDENIIDTLLYIVNFGEDDGFAVMDANNGDLLVLTEKGDLHAEDFNIVTDTNNINYNNPSVSVASLLTRGYNDGFVQNPNPGGTPTPGVSFYFYTSWETESTIAPIVKVKFHQYSPYNDDCPIRGTSNPAPAPAGCGPIAVIQLMSALKYPSTIDNISYDWDIIINNYTNTYHPLHATLSKWIHKIGKQSSVSYGADGSGTTLLLTRLCLLAYDKFSNVNLKYDISYDNIINMINLGLPIICQGCQSNSITTGHIWLLDGMAYQYRYRKEYRNNVLVSQTKETRQLVHCNYGWGGTCDGYYKIDLFNVGEGPITRENIDTGNPTSTYPDFNYNTCMLTYEFN